MLARSTTQPVDWPKPFSYLPRPVRVPDRAWQSILVGWLTTFVPSVAIGAIVTKLLPGAGLPDLGPANWLVAVLVVVVSPAIETLIMAGVLELLVRLVPPPVAVVMSAIGWGVAHSLAAPAWGLVIWWPFLIFSTLYLSWRRRSVGAALAIVATTHALQNALPMFAMLLAAK